MPRVLWWSDAGGLFLMSEVPLRCGDARVTPATQQAAKVFLGTENPQVYDRIRNNPPMSLRYGLP